MIGNLTIVCYCQNTIRTLGLTSTLIKFKMKKMGITLKTTSNNRKSNRKHPKGGGGGNG